MNCGDGDVGDVGGVGGFGDWRGYGGCMVLVVAWCWWLRGGDKIFVRKNYKEQKVNHMVQRMPSRIRKCQEQTRSGCHASFPGSPISVHH